MLNCALATALAAVSVVFVAAFASASLSTFIDPVVVVSPLCLRLLRCPSLVAPVAMDKQHVLDTVQIGLQQGATGDVRKLIAGAVDVAVGVQIGGVWLPILRPRLRQ